MDTRVIALAQTLFPINKEKKEEIIHRIYRIEMTGQVLPPEQWPSS